MRKQIAVRRRPLMTYALQLIAEETGLNDSAIIRLAVLDFAQQHGYIFRGASELLVAARDLAAKARLVKVQGVDKELERMEQLLDKHRTRLARIYKFSHYPVDVERILLEEEKRIPRGRSGRQKAGRSGQA